MNNFFKYILALFFVVIIISLLVNGTDFRPDTSTQTENQIEFIAINDTKIQVELVTTPAAQALGLSGRESLDADMGMFFIFDKVSKYRFWMKDMNFPIDMIFFDAEGKIIYIKENATPESFPKLFGPDKDAKYVLEVVANFASKNKIKIGDSFVFLPK